MYKGNSDGFTQKRNYYYSNYKIIMIMLSPRRIINKDINIIVMIPSISVIVILPHRSGIIMLPHRRVIVMFPPISNYYDSL